MPFIQTTHGTTLNDSVRKSQSAAEVSLSQRSSRSVVSMQSPSSAAIGRRLRHSPSESCIYSGHKNASKTLVKNDLLVTILAMPTPDPRHSSHFCKKLVRVASQKTSLLPSGTLDTSILMSKMTVADRCALESFSIETRK